jgi:urease beta subunit
MAKTNKIINTCQLLSTSHRFLSFSQNCIACKNNPIQIGAAYRISEFCHDFDHKMSAGLRIDIIEVLSFAFYYRTKGITIGCI